MVKGDVTIGSEDAKLSIGIARMTYKWFKKTSVDSNLFSSIYVSQTWMAVHFIYIIGCVDESQLKLSLIKVVKC